jgi:DNA repair protein RadC
VFEAPGRAGGVVWISNGYDAGSHASVGRYFLKTMPVGGNRFVWSVSSGVKIVAGSEAVDLTWHGGYKGEHSERSARVAAELAMTLHKNRKSLERPTGTSRSRLHTMRETAVATSRRSNDVEPIVLAGKPGSKCRPFLTVLKDDDKFAACNALADEIGPLNDPKKVFRLLEDAIGDEMSEVFGVMTLDLHGRLKGMTETGRGEASSVMAPMIPTLRAALLSGGGGAIVFHVHPSGIEAEPSDADKDTTEAFDEAFEAIGLPLLDHIVIAGSKRKRSYFSFREAGLL